MWAVTIMMYWLKLGGGIVCGGLSVLWLVHVVLYVMLAPPLYPFLNTFFAKMDRVFPLFGTLAFAIACFYLIGESIVSCVFRIEFIFLLARSLQTDGCVRIH